VVYSTQELTPSPLSRRTGFIDGTVEVNRRKDQDYSSPYTCAMTEGRSTGSLYWPARASRWEGPVIFNDADNIALRLLSILHPPHIVRRYRQALSLLYRGEISQAAAAISELSRDVGDRDVILASKLAQLYVHHDVVHPSLEVFRCADEGDDTQAPWFFNILASAYVEAGFTDKARRVYTHMLALGVGDRLETYLSLAQTYELEDALPEACHIYELTWTEFPHDGYVGMKLACLWHILGRPEKVEVVLLKILAEPRSAEMSLYHGMAHLALGHPEKAVPHLVRARGAYSLDPLPPYYLALCYIMQEKVDLAEEYLKEACRKDSTLWDTDVELFTKVVTSQEQFNTLLSIWPID